MSEVKKLKIGNTSYDIVDSSAAHSLNDIAAAGAGITFTTVRQGYSEVGSPTITDGVLSNITTSNYITMQEPFSPTSSPWEMKMKFTTGSTWSVAQSLFACCKDTSTNNGRFGINLIITTSKKFDFFCSNSGSSWLFDVTGNTSLSDNTTYYIKFGWTGTQYYLKYSTDDTTYTDEITYSSSTQLYYPLVASFIGIASNPTMYRPFLGSIDLNECFITENDAIIWQAVGGALKTIISSNAGAVLQNTSTGSNSLSILGTASSASSSTNIGVGTSVVDYYGGQTVLGYDAVSSQQYTCAYGAHSRASGKYSVAIGAGGYTSSYLQDNTTASIRSVAIGGDCRASGEASVAIGVKARASSAGAIAIGTPQSANYSTSASGSNSIAIGQIASASQSNSIAVGFSSTSSGQYAIQLGPGTNSTANTLSVGLSGSNNYQLLDSSGHIPAARLTNAVQGALTGSTITLASADWSSNTQTVTVSGMTSSAFVWVSPVPASASDYASAGILCTAQGTDSLTFTCSTAPTSDISVQIVYG